MAMKTIACPECGTTVAPGRYACAECGALLAAVGMIPRTWAAVEQPVPADAERTAAEPAVDVLEAVEPAASPARNGGPKRSRRARAAGAVPETPPPIPAATPPIEATAPAPIARVTPPPVAPPTAAPSAAPPLASPVAPLVAPPVPEWPVAPVAPGFSPSRSDAPTAAPTAAAAAPPLPTPASWPPADSLPPLPTPAVRTPAGAYLAPSAVLPPLDGPSARNGHDRSGAPSGRDHAAGPGSSVRSSFGETLESIGITADMPRRLVGAGAAIAALGFLLPWINALGGGGALIDDYLSYWGLAGPGHWLVALALLVLVGFAFAEGPFHRFRVGAIALMTAALLLGLLWTYLFGVPMKSVGVWIVLAGAALIAIGGLLDLRRRHAADTSVV